MRALALVSMLTLGACGALPSGPPLVSGQYPPGTGAVNANGIVQTANSLPPGAANYSRAPGGTMTDFGGITIGSF